MKIRILSIFITVIIVLMPALSGCTDKPAETAVNTDESTEAGTVTVTEEDTAVHDDLPKMNFNNYTYRIIGQGGAGWTAGDMLRPETFTEDEFNDAKLKRYLNIEERFGVKIETFLSETIQTTVQGAILSNDHSFDLINMDTVNTSSAALGKLLYNLYDLEYLDLSKPYYDQNYVHDMSYEDKLFSVVTDITTMDMFVTWILMYNKNMIRRYDLESPYDLVRNNQWTFDKFNEMIKGISVDNGDGRWDEKDTYGFAAHTGSAGNFFYAAGLTICSKDENDVPYISLGEKSEVLSIASGKITDMLYTDNKTLLNNQIVEAFADGRALFLAEITGYLDVFRSMKDDFGVIPYPKLTPEQTRYYTTNSNCIMVFSIPAFNYRQDELERSSIIFEGLNSESYKLIRPAYYINVLKGKQTRDYRDYEMLDLIRNSRVYDFGLFNDLGRLSSIFSSLASSKNPKVSSTLKSALTKGESKLSKIIEKYQSID